MLKEEEVLDEFCFEIIDTTTPTLSEHLVKRLGKLFDSSLKDTATTHKTCHDLEALLFKVDKSGLPGGDKAWVSHNAILLRVFWPHLLYNETKTLRNRIRSCLPR